MYEYLGFTIPPSMMGGLLRYMHEGVPPGDFLRAVLTNDLTRAVMHADSTNIRNIPAFVGWLHQYAEPDSWGSEALYTEWLKRKAEERTRFLERTEIERQAYIAALKSHDWAYEWSDDHRVWAVGRDQRMNLHGMAYRIDSDYSIWNSIAPEASKMKGAS